ncbi:MAG: S46 family peptidase [Ignavibacteriales bacterium]|nr:S46 family peptidase [Ignavibacteriales bacterium]
MKRSIIMTSVALIFLMLSAFTFPDEGMWMLQQISKLPFTEMQKHGMELTPEQVYSTTSTSLKDAIVLLGGGTSSFISGDGLLLTNHHVAYGAIQSVSSVEEDRLKDGFLAASKADEIPIPSYQARIVLNQKDVTADVLSAVSDTMAPDARSKAIRTKMNEIEKKEKGDSENECRVSEFFGGMKYFLFTFEVFRDVRLVYAPPTSIGNYGGEVDNWMWPRHTGDFSLMRAYIGPDGKHSKYAKENVPCKPKVFLPISTQGFKEDDFAMILGFPGTTYRYRTTPEIKLAKEESLPMTIDLYKTRMDIIETAGKNDRATEIKYSSKWRGLANPYKKFLGTLEGMRRADLLTLRNANEEIFAQFLATNPDLQKKYGSIISDIRSLYETLATFNKKQIMLGQLLQCSDVLSIANRFRTYLKPPETPTREVRTPEQNLSDLKDAINNTFKNLNLTLDKQLLSSMILKAAELPESQQIEAIQKIVGSKTGEKRIKEVQEFVDDLYDDTKLANKEDCLKMTEKSESKILDDPFVEFALAIDKNNSQIQKKNADFTAKITILRTKLLEAYSSWKGPDMYPDANRTIRMTYGVVKSFKPRDAVHYDYVTSLGGVIEKETGVDPFIVSPKLRQLWEKRDFGKYADPRINDVPVAFIADLDITGGNSGSPVINGKGELIGLAFDGNWESVVGDYYFQDQINRTISVDARYILFIIDKFSNAKNIMDELLIK